MGALQIGRLGLNFSMDGSFKKSASRVASFMNGLCARQRKRPSLTGEMSGSPETLAEIEYLKKQLEAKTNEVQSLKAQVSTLETEKKKLC